MKIVLLAFALLFTTQTQAGIYIGHGQSYHLLQSGLNNSHPYLGVEGRHIGAMAYQTSFDTIGVSAYAKIEGKVYNKVTIESKFGVTTGYQRIMTYNGYEYEQQSVFVSDGLMMAIVPSLKYNITKQTQGVLEVFGDAINIGLKLTFN